MIAYGITESRQFITDCKYLHFRCNRKKGQSVKIGHTFRILEVVRGFLRGKLSHMIRWHIVKCIDSTTPVRTL